MKEAETKTVSGSRNQKTLKEERTMKKRATTLVLAVVTILFALTAVSEAQAYFQGPYTMSGIIQPKNSFLDKLEPKPNFIIKQVTVFKVYCGTDWTPEWTDYSFQSLVLVENIGGNRGLSENNRIYLSMTAVTAWGEYSTQYTGSGYMTAPLAGEKKLASVWMHMNSSSDWHFFGGNYTEIEYYVNEEHTVFNGTNWEYVSIDESDLSDNAYYISLDELPSQCSLPPGVAIEVN